MPHAASRLVPKARNGIVCGNCEFHGSVHLVIMQKTPILVYGKNHLGVKDEFCRLIDSLIESQVTMYLVP